MSVESICPHCFKSLRFKSEIPAGKRVRCRECGESFKHRPEEQERSTSDDEWSDVEESAPLSATRRRSKGKKKAKPPKKTIGESLLDEVKDYRTWIAAGLTVASLVGSMIAYSQITHLSHDSRGIPFLVAVLTGVCSVPVFAFGGYRWARWILGQALVVILYPFTAALAGGGDWGIAVAAKTWADIDSEKAGRRRSKKDSQRRLPVIAALLGSLSLGAMATCGSLAFARRESVMNPKPVIVNPKVRFDGIYRAYEDDYWACLRFFPDGRVVSASIGGEATPKNMQPWFKPWNDGTRTANVTINGDHIEFTLEGSRSTTSVSGDIQDGALRLYHNNTHRYRPWTSTYRFIDWDGNEAPDPAAAPPAEPQQQQPVEPDPQPADPEPAEAEPQPEENAPRRGRRPTQ